MLRQGVLVSLWVGLVLISAFACEPVDDKLANRKTADMVTDAETLAEVDLDSLQNYDGTVHQFPLKAQYPAAMQVDDGCGEEGCVFFFTFVPQGNALDAAAVRIFLPTGAATAAELEPFVTGPDGLIEKAGWLVTGVAPEGADEFPYAWVDTVISFSSKRGEVGYILLGQAEGQAVQVILQFPAAVAEVYWPVARTILDTLEFDAALLPLSPLVEKATGQADSSDRCDPSNTKSG